MASTERHILANHPDYGSTSTDFVKPLNSTDLYVSPPAPNARESLKIILASSKINLLLIFIPLGYLVYIFELSDTWGFSKFLTIIPLAKLLDYATADISLRVGQVFIAANEFKISLV